MPKKRWNKINILKYIKNKANELGRTPKQREIIINPQAIIKYFDTFNNAIKEAGLKPLKEFNKDKIYYLKIIDNWIKENNKLPSVYDFKNNPYLPDSKTITKKCNMTWNQIIKNLGYEPKSKIPLTNYNDLTDTELIYIFKNEIKRLNSINHLYYNKNRLCGIPSYTYYRKRFNNITWNNLLKKANIKNIKYERRTKKEWIKIIQNIAKELNHSPSIKELKNKGYYSDSIEKKFGSYNNAIKTAGLLNKKTPIEVTETNEELINMYINFSKKINKPASKIDLDGSDEIYNADVFMFRFGGMTGLKTKAGFEITRYKNKSIYTKEDILKELKVVYKKYRRRLSYKELSNEKTLPSISTILRHFKTTNMKQVWLGIEKQF